MRIVLIFCLLIGTAWAQDYPSRQVTIVSSTGAGSASDLIGRMLAPRLQQRFGRPVIVENRTGASGNIGVASVVKAAPDGHTLLIAPSTLTITPWLVKDLGWDPSRDLQAVARLAVISMALAVNSNVPAQNATQFIALAKERPGALNYGTPGSGTPQHLGMELFKQATGANLTHVPYKNLPGAVTDVLGGRVDGGFFAVQSVLPHAKAGKLRLIATTGDRRTPWTPDVPTLQEQGVVGADVESWIGLFAPTGTPPAIVGRLYEEVAALLATPEVAETLFQGGVQAGVASPNELRDLVKTELERYRRVVTAAGLRAE
ncbi:MAG TPA: tripartite tricarboxylate transporter substrate binding protein [Burkholderiales bacterium]|nr:tripartite tricarboxylate transporter substrate binding protein [Burkholderiales bacterium]